MTVKEEIFCAMCEAEFYIEHDQEEAIYCPFCGEELPEEADEWDDDYEDEE
jgi:hypothetical protein